MSEAMSDKQSAPPVEREQSDEAVRRDAERYRWLRKNWQFSLHGKPVWLELDADVVDVDSTDKLDGIIDAAMQRTSKESQT